MEMLAKLTACFTLFHVTYSGFIGGRDEIGGIKGGIGGHRGGGLAIFLPINGVRVLGQDGGFGSGHGDFGGIGDFGIGNGGFNIGGFDGNNFGGKFGNFGRPHGGKGGFGNFGGGLGQIGIGGGIGGGFGGFGTGGSKLRPGFGTNKGSAWR